VCELEDEHGVGVGEVEDRCGEVVGEAEDKPRGINEVEKSQVTVIHVCKYVKM
jgi:hypothetical protein